MVGMTKGEAEAEANSEGFTKLRFQGPDDGRVVRTDPGAGVQVPPGTTITIVLEKTPESTPTETPGVSTRA